MSVSNVKRDDGLRFPAHPPVLSAVTAGRDGSPWALELGPVTHGDIDDITRISRQESIQRWTRVPSPYTPSDGEWFVEQAGRDWNDTTNLVFGIRAGRERAYAGTIAVISIERDLCHAEIGYMVSEEFAGQGVATAALETVAEWAFDHGLLRITLLVATGNAGSSRVAEKAGFEREGIMKARFPRKGVVHDMVVWGKVNPLKSSWETGVPEPTRLNG